MTVLLASDLDRTLIFSRSAAALSPDPCGPLVCVERYQDEDASFMTAHAARLLVELAGAAELVPVTTRVPTQLARVVLPTGPSRYAVAANGGVLLVDGIPDRDWERQVEHELSSAAPLSEVRSHLERVCDERWTARLRDADGLFCYAVVRRDVLPVGVVAELDSWAADHGWTTSLQGSKLYVVPRSLTKSAAVAEVTRRIDAAWVLAAGDSLLDIDLLAAADRGIHPAHGEIADCGWAAPHVDSTGSVGAQAGEDICRWFAAQLALLSVG